jgi:hypothetical protein
VNGSLHQRALTQLCVSEGSREQCAAGGLDCRVWKDVPTPQTGPVGRSRAVRETREKPWPSLEWYRNCFPSLRWLGAGEEGQCNRGTTCRRCGVVDVVNVVNVVDAFGAFGAFGLADLFGVVEALGVTDAVDFGGDDVMLASASADVTLHDGTVGDEAVEERCEAMV